MTISANHNVKEYYRQVTEIDIGAVARELLGSRITQETPMRLMCDCPNHQSQSHRSLHVSLDVQIWNCFGCGKGGDVLQLVEFVQSGVVTAGQSGQMPESHRAARDWLAKRAGLPPLSTYGLSDEEVAHLEKKRAFETRVLDALTAIAEYYHERLLNNPEALDWLKAHYAINDASIDSLKIGYAANSPWRDANGIERKDLKATLLEQGFSAREIMATSAFIKPKEGRPFPFFQKRIIFPYWNRGRVSFLIGRSTPWTSQSKHEEAKYKKLSVHNERDHAYVAECINNRTLFNEDCLLARPKRLIITEGITDAIALMQAGFPVVSPVTTRVSAKDWEHFIPRLRGVKTVYICQDNEVSEAGLKGALQTAAQLTKHNIEALIVALPRPEGLDKVDVNDFFRSGATAEDFEALMAQARVPLEFAIDAIPVDAPRAKRDKLLNSVLSEIADRPALEQDQLLKAIQKRFGKDEYSITVLREHMKGLSRNSQSADFDAREQRIRAKYESPAPEGSCRACVNKVLMETELMFQSPDYTAAAEAAFEWFKSHGGMFFRTGEGSPFMCFDNDLFWMDSGDRARKRKYAALMFEQTEMLQTTNGGRSFFDVIASLAVTHGEERDHLSWLHTDVTTQTIWFNLNNREHEIAKITPDGVEIMKNGSNPDKMILSYSPKMAPLKFLPDADLTEADHALMELLADNFSCAQGDRLFILAWLSCFLLLDFAGTKPMTRFEGASGSGKTTAAKLITALLYGEPQQKIATMAANYTDGAQNPLLSLDNIEVQQMTDGLTEFMLTSITGVAREKRKGGTDTENVSEHVKCLLNTTGIEPLRGDLSEILSRTFTIEFDTQAQSNACFLDAEVVAAIRAKRDLILSALMKRTSHVLAMIRDGKRRRALAAMQEALGPHDKRRCNDYLSLMYLMTLAGAPDDEIEPLFDKPYEQFIEQIRRINQTSRETARGANPISAALDALFNAWRNAIALDEKAKYETHEHANHVATFIERYHLSSFESSSLLIDVSATQLCTAFGVIARQFGLNCQYKNAVQLGKRIRNDHEIIKEAGFEITAEIKRSKKTSYCIRRLAD